MGLEGKPRRGSCADRWAALEYRMTTAEIILWSLFLLIAVVCLGLVLVGMYRAIYRCLSGDYRASQQARTLVEQGRFHLRKGDFEQAISICKRAMMLDPSSAQACSMCGLARARQGDHSAAVADYDRALDLNPADAATHLNRGLAHQQLGNTKMALADFDEAAVLTPDDPIIRLSRLKLHQELGDTETALADLKHIMEVSPELAEKELTKALLSELQESQGL
jgi:tetratricopeptide (TPR) repeat protein